MDILRCPWPGENKLMIDYHDTEWGNPLHDDIKLFEFLVLDAFQAGLSWAIILKKREDMRRAFDNFNPEIISKYDENKIQELLQDPGIIRNKLKVNSAIINARIFLETREKFGSFDKFIWQFTDGKTIHNKWTGISQIPAKSAESDAMSKEMKRMGFKFCGSTICYAFMQAAGMVNDHLTSCFRYKQIVKLSK